jgi:Protein of unknown function (DUF3995)
MPESATHARRRVGGHAARVASTAVPATLAAIGALHAAWAVGWRWPGGNDREWARRVMDDAKPPPPVAVWGAAAAFPAAGAVVAAAARGSGGRRMRLGAWAITAGLLGRSVAFVPADLAGGVRSPFDRLDLLVYAPLSLALGGGTAAALRRAGGGEDRRL